MEKVYSGSCRDSLTVNNILVESGLCQSSDNCEVLVYCLVVYILFTTRRRKIVTEYFIVRNRGQVNQDDVYVIRHLAMLKFHTF